MPTHRTWPDPHVKPPYGAVELDRGHGLAHKLVFLAVLNEGGGGGINLVNGGAGTRNGNAAWGVNSGGLAVSVAGGSDQFQFNAADYSASPFSGFAIFRQTSTNDYQAVGGNGVSGSTTGWGLYPRYSAVSTLQLAYPGLDVKNSGLTVTDGVLTAAGFAQSSVGVGGTEIQFVVNGSRAQTSSAAPTSGATKMTLSGILRDTGIDSPFVGTINLWAVWSGRALSVSDMLWLTAEPYAMLRPIVRRRYFVPAAGTSIPRKMHHYASMR